MATPAVVELIIQRTDADCAIASLGMLLGKPYREVSDAATSLSPRPHKVGMWTTEILRVAKRLGCPLKRQPLTAVDDDATGLLVVRKVNGVSHVVLLFQGVVVDPSSGLLYDLATYLKSKRYHVRAFLTS